MAFFAFFHVPFLLVFSVLAALSLGVFCSEVGRVLYLTILLQELGLLGCLIACRSEAVRCVFVCLWLVA